MPPTSGSGSCAWSARPETPTPTRRSGPGRSSSARSRRPHARSPMRRPSSIPISREHGARANREVGIAQLRRHRARRLPALTQVLGEADGHPAQLVVQALEVAHVAREGLLVRDRDPLGRDLERPRIDAAGAVADEPPDLPRQDPRQLRIGDRGEVADRLDLGCGQPRGGAGADPGQHPDRERREERGLAARPDDGQAAGLAAIGGDLRDQLRRRNAERARQPRPRPDDGAYGLGQRARVVECRRDLAEVEVALVDSRLLDRGHDVADDRPHLPRVSR